MKEGDDNNIISYIKKDCSKYNNIIPKSGLEQKFMQEISPLASDYLRLRELAANEDDFQRVLDFFRDLARRAYAIGLLGEAKTVLKEAHKIYVKKQLSNARVFGSVGDFDTFEDFLQNAHVQVSGEVTLECLVTDNDRERLFDVALSSTNPAYFLERIVKKSEEGDVEDTGKYIHLALKCMEMHGMIKIPDSLKDPTMIPSDQTDRFMRVHKKLMKYHMKAYTVAVNKLASEAMGYAVKDQYDSKRQIEERLGKVQELIYEAVRRFVPDERMHDVFLAYLNYFNHDLNPFFQEMVACCDDKTHPFREMFEVVMGGKYGYDIIGARRKVVETTAIVPLRRQTCGFDIPIRIHPFYNTVLDRYQAAN